MTTHHPPTVTGHIQPKHYNRKVFRLLTMNSHFQVENNRLKPNNTDPELVGQSRAVLQFEESPGSTGQGAG